MSMPSELFRLDRIYCRTLDFSASDLRSGKIRILKACCPLGVYEQIAVGCEILSSLIYSTKSSHGTILLSTVFLRLTIAYLLS